MPAFSSAKAPQAPVSFSNYLPATDKWQQFLLAPMQDGNIPSSPRNITDSKKMQRELRKANEQLSSLNKYLVNQNKQLEDFAHITSHNLRAPIANLKALMQIMNDTDEEQEKALYRGMFQEVIRNIDETLNDPIEVVQIRKDLNVERERLVFSERLQKVKDILFVDIETSGIELITDLVKRRTLSTRAFTRTAFCRTCSRMRSNTGRQDRRPRLMLQSRLVDGG